jgi:RNA polymerase sigma-70 factor (ECF subfamily)
MNYARQSRAEMVEQLEPLRNPLMRFFMSRVMDRTEAEDLTQATFARLLAASGEEELRDPKRFVFGAAINLLRDRARRRKVRNSAQIAAVTSARICDTTLEFVEDVDPERVLQAKDQLAHVMAALNELKPRTRDMYLLFRLDDMKHGQIAKLYGLSVSSVEKEIIRATRHLAVRFGKKA